MTEVREPKIPYPVVLQGQVGSGLHGVTVDNQDDRDEMGICIESPKALIAGEIGRKPFEQYIFRTQPEGHRSGPGDLDLVVYSLRKWTRLALQGNPTILLPLFIPEQEIVAIDSVGSWMQDHPEMFLSKNVADRFLGYMKSQREQMTGERSKHTNRPELIEIYGYDTKFAYHMLRLGMQGIELLTDHTITLPIPRPQRELLLAVRRGQFTKEEVIRFADQLEDELKYAAEETSLPDKPNYASVSHWLTGIYRLKWIEYSDKYEIE